MQYHATNIEKLPKRIKKMFQILHTKLDRALDLILKLLFLKSPTLLKAVTVMNQTLEGYTSRFWKSTFRLKDVHAQKFPRTDFLNLRRRKVMIYFCQKGKKNGGVTDFVLERTCPEK